MAGQNVTRERRELIWARVAATVAGFATILGGLVAVGITTFDLADPENSPPTATVSIQAPRLDRLENDLTGLRAQVEALRRTPSNTRVGADIAAVRATVRRIADNLNALETAVGQDPVKALELPLLRRDLDSLSAANQAANQSTRDEIERQYDLMKWVFGTFIVALLGTLVTAILALRRSA